MMNTKRFRVAVAMMAMLIAGISTGCKKFLDLDPLSTWRDETFYSSASEVEMALAGIYSEMANDDMYGYKFNVVLESGTDEMYTNSSAANWGAARYAYTSSSDEVQNIWLHFYGMINLVNQLEKNLDPEMFSEEQTNRYLAKARFMRAFAYFNLANWFGPV
ncbi:MAG TPA: RagB/SusD family nutrient uptake outer membrane protein, partial [Sphingobacterium sp.]|nr:RagB/SusD family nutrient uptake outer membrane protein [Sphingobacterium sp.]